MAVMTAAQVAALVRSVGWTSDADIRTMVAIAYDESKFDSKAVGGPNRNGTKDYGLFQINEVHKPTAAEKTQPLANTKKARQVYAQQGFKAWSTYNKGLSGAAKKQGEIGLTKIKNNPGYADEAVKDEQTPTVQDDLSASGIPTALRNGIDAVTGALFKAGISVGAFVLGAVFLVLGFLILTKTSPAKLAKVTPVGKVLGK